MRPSLILIASLVCLPPGVPQPKSVWAGHSPPRFEGQSNGNPPAKASPWPLQLEMRVPFGPTAFPSEGRTHLMYELHLANFGPFPLPLKRLEVLDAASAGVFATFEGEDLEKMVQFVGANDAPGGKLDLLPGRSAIVFIEIAKNATWKVPEKLLHRVISGDSAVEGASITTHQTVLQVLGPPLEGENWLADDGPSNDRENHHRRGVVIVDGQAVDSRRYAIDWKQIKDNVSFSGDAGLVSSYYSYGKNVLVVGDSRVVNARDGLPENVPGHGEAFHPAVPITLDTVSGNNIVLDLGNGQFAFYMHLRPGSVRVKTGDRVRRGQVIGQVGASGDAREPHLHFEVTTSPRLLAGEGVPYLIDHYRCTSASGGQAELRTHELPLDKSVAAFGGEGK